MSTIRDITPLQIALGFSRRELAQTPTIRLSISSGVAGTQTRSILLNAGGLPILSGTWYNDRGADPSNSLPVLVCDCLTAIEAAIGNDGEWEPMWDARFPGSLGLLRRFGSGIASLDFTHEDMTFDPTLIGLVKNTVYTVEPGRTLEIPHQPKRLWLPGDRYATEWRSTPNVSGSVWVNPHTGDVRRSLYGSVKRWILRVDNIPELFVLQSAAAYDHHRAFRPGIISTDPHVSLASLWSEGLKTESPLRIWLARDTLAQWVERQWAEEEFGSLLSVLEPGTEVATHSFTFNLTEPGA